MRFVCLLRFIRPLFAVIMPTLAAQARDIQICHAEYAPIFKPKKENFRSKLADTPVCGDTSKAFPPLTEEQEETVYFNFLYSSAMLKTVQRNLHDFKACPFHQSVCTVNHCEFNFENKTFLYHNDSTLEVVNRAVDITVLENKFYHALKSISSWDIPSGSSSDSANVDNVAYTKFVWVYGFSG